MSEPVLEILRNADLRAIQEDKLGSQATLLDVSFPGAHAATETAPVLRSCNASDPQQLWGPNFAQTVDVLPARRGGARPPIPRIRNGASATYCLTAPCNASGGGALESPLAVRSCEDWNVDRCPTTFGGQIWSTHSAGAGAKISVIISNRTANNSDPHSPGLCLTAPAADADADTPVALAACGDVAEGQTWKWDQDPLASGDAHPDHPGNTIELMGRKGMRMCLSTSFTEAEMNEVYIGKLESKQTPGQFEGSWVVAFFNRGPLPKRLWVSLKRLQYSGRITVSSWTATDIFAADPSKKDMGIINSSQILARVVAPHDIALFRLDAVFTQVGGLSARQKTDDDLSPSAEIVIGAGGSTALGRHSTQLLGITAYGSPNFHQPAAQALVRALGIRSIGMQAMVTSFAPANLSTEALKAWFEVDDEKTGASPALRYANTTFKGNLLRIIESGGIRNAGAEPWIYLKTGDGAKCKGTAAEGHCFPVAGTPKPDGNGQWSWWSTLFVGVFSLLHRLDSSLRYVHIW